GCVVRSVGAVREDARRRALQAIRGRAQGGEGRADHEAVEGLRSGLRQFGDLETRGFSDYDALQSPNLSPPNPPILKSQTLPGFPSTSADRRTSGAAPD